MMMKLLSAVSAELFVAVVTVDFIAAVVRRGGSTAVCLQHCRAGNYWKNCDPKSGDDLDTRNCSNNASKQCHASLDFDGWSELLIVKIIFGQFLLH